MALVTFVGLLSQSLDLGIASIVKPVVFNVSPCFRQDDFHGEDLDQVGLFLGLEVILEHLCLIRWSQERYTVESSP